MINMTSFKNVMERAIRSSYTTKERKYFEEKIATWSLNGNKQKQSRYY